MTDFQKHLTSHNLPACDLIQEIASPVNIADAFDYVVGHLECAQQREHLRPKKAQYCRDLQRLLSTGQFRITDSDFRTIHVTDGPKERDVQAPSVFHRIGCHAVMVPFEAHAYPTLINNTAASIKNRGMHWLHNIIEEDLSKDPEGTLYYYQCDIYHYYDSIDQQLMMSQVRQYTTDPTVLPMLDNFIQLLPAGLSKGLRASQCLANLHLSEVDHEMCKLVASHNNGTEDRFHYYRYCDDIVIIGRDKKQLWQLRDHLCKLLANLGLRIKPTEAVRPLCTGLDYLGYKTFVDDSDSGRTVYSYIRKRTKKKFARRLKAVKSRKRRQSLIGSFFGMAAHADCRHLLKTLITPQEYKKLKHYRKMKEFGNFKVKPTTLNGQKNFKGNKITAQELDRKGIIVVDFERDVVPKREREDYNRRLQTCAMQGGDPSLVEKPKTKYIISLFCDNQLRKLWTGDRELWQILDQLESEDALPMFMGVEIDYSGQYRKINFVPPSKLGLRVPSDAELNALRAKYNLNQ